MNPKIDKAFQDWLCQGPSRPTNGDLVVADNIDIELLEHLATYMWYAAIRNNVWYTFHDGSSPDGRGPAEFQGRTMNKMKAKEEWFNRIKDNPYSTGYVTAITRDEEVRIFSEQDFDRFPE